MREEGGLKVYSAYYVTPRLVLRVSMVGGNFLPSGRDAVAIYHIKKNSQEIRLFFHSIIFFRFQSINSRVPSVNLKKESSA